MRLLPAAMALLLLWACSERAPGSPAQEGAAGPIIDMHMHAWSLSDFGGEEAPPGCLGAYGVDMHGVDPAKPFDFAGQAICKVTVPPPASDDEMLRDMLAEMDRFNIVTGVLAGEPDQRARWMAASPGRFLPAANFFVDENLPPTTRLAELEQLAAAGNAQVFAEITPQYRGLDPDDPGLEPYYALAERLDVPVGVHMGYGAPGGPYWIYPAYRAAKGNPLLLEDLLVRHPKLRLYVMHAGMPMTDEMIAVLYSHPQVYVDISADNVGVPRAEFYVHLRRLVEAGYGKRIMFGSDQMIWPEAIEVAVKSITEAPFLSPEQKRDILYNNAARFLRLSEETIARHHNREP